MCGTENGTKCYEHQFGFNSWVSFPSLGIHREGFTLNRVGETLVVVGGLRVEYEIEIYENKKWIKGPHIPETDGLIHHCSVR